MADRDLNFVRRTYLDTAIISALTNSLVLVLTTVVPTFRTYLYKDDYGPSLLAGSLIHSAIPLFLGALTAMTTSHKCTLKRASKYQQKKNNFVAISFTMVNISSLLILDSIIYAASDGNALSINAKRASSLIKGAPLPLYWLLSVSVHFYLKMKYRRPPTFSERLANPNIEIIPLRPNPAPVRLNLLARITLNYSLFTLYSMVVFSLTHAVDIDVIPNLKDKWAPIAFIGISLVLSGISSVLMGLSSKCTERHRRFSCFLELTPATRTVLPVTLSAVLLATQIVALYSVIHATPTNMIMLLSTEILPSVWLGLTIGVIKLATCKKARPVTAIPINTDSSSHTVPMPTEPTRISAALS